MLIKVSAPLIRFADAPKKHVKVRSNCETAFAEASERFVINNSVSNNVLNMRLESYKKCYREGEMRVSEQ